MSINLREFKKPKGPYFSVVENYCEYSIRKRPGLFLNKSGHPQEKVRPSMA